MGSMTEWPHTITLSALLFELKLCQAPRSAAMGFHERYCESRDVWRKRELRTRMETEKEDANLLTQTKRLDRNAPISATGEIPWLKNKPKQIFLKSSPKTLAQTLRMSNRCWLDFAAILRWSMNRGERISPSCLEMASQRHPLLKRPRPRMAANLVRMARLQAKRKSQKCLPSRANAHPESKRLPFAARRLRSLKTWRRASAYPQQLRNETFQLNCWMRTGGSSIVICRTTIAAKLHTPI